MFVGDLYYWLIFANIQTRESGHFYFKPRNLSFSESVHYANMNMYGLLDFLNYFVTANLKMELLETNPIHFKCEVT